MAKKSSWGDLSERQKAGLMSRLRDLVEKIGTQRQAAAVAQLDPRQITRMLSGEAAPSLLPVARLAEAAGKSIDWVVTGRDARVGSSVNVDLLTELADGIDAAYLEVGVELAIPDLTRRAAREYDLIVSVTTNEAEAWAGLRLALERTRRRAEEEAKNGLSSVRRRSG